MHNRARRARPSSQREVVHNSAAAQAVSSEQLAAAGTQTGASHPARVMARTLTRPSACGPIAERTLPQEGRCIRSRPPRNAGLQSRRSKPMKAWTELTHFAALDWADDHHDLVVVDAQGQVALELTFTHNAEGWQQAQQALAAWPGLPVAIETSAGPAVDQLLQRGFVLYPTTPKALAAAGKRKWEKFLHTHKLWRPQTSSQRMEIFARATAFSGGEAITAAKSLLAQSLARLLQTLEQQLANYRARIQALFDQHPDHDLFGSLPGAGAKLAPRLLAELAGADWSQLSQVQARAGTAPVTYQSGKIRRVKIRRACTHPLRATLHLWADLI